MCGSGFHACLRPTDVFKYYAPGGARFAEVELSGKILSEGDKSCASKIRIVREMSLQELIQEQIAYSKANGQLEPSNTASGAYGAACGVGYGSKAKAGSGCALLLVERDSSYRITAVFAGIAGQGGIKPDVFYTLRDGKPEAET